MTVDDSQYLLITVLAIISIINSLSIILLFSMIKKDTNT